MVDSGLYVVYIWFNKWFNIWFIHGLYMVYMWFICGLYVVYIWFNIWFNIWFIYGLPSSKLAVRPCQIGLEDDFPLGIGDFQGRSVNLPECNRRKFRSETSDNMDRWKSTARKKLSHGESQTKEDQR